MATKTRRHEALSGRVSFVSCWLGVFVPSCLRAFVAFRGDLPRWTVQQLRDVGAVLRIYGFGRSAQNLFEVRTRARDLAVVRQSDREVVKRLESPRIELHGSRPFVVRLALVAALQ